LLGLAQIDYPDEDDEQDSDICKVTDGLYIGGALPGLPMCRGTSEYFCGNGCLQLFAAQKGQAL